MPVFNFQPHYLTGSSPTRTLSLLINNGFRVSPRYLIRVTGVLISDLFLWPLHIADTFFFNKKIQRVKVAPSPIFIIGHWRSGTTYMHNLFSHDDQFAFPSTYQCFMPGLFLSGGKVMKQVLSFLMPDRRPVDNSKMEAGLPQEEEFALNALCKQSYYQALCFPQHTREHFNKYARLDVFTKDKWKYHYQFFLKKVCYSQNNKRLVCKNPTNTVRIKHLLELYPDAKFIYMRRIKSEVLGSAFNLYKALLRLYTFQTISDQEIKENVNWIYEQTMREYDKQKDLIPDSQLIEINYDELVANPMSQIDSIYTRFGIQYSESTRKNFEKYIETQRAHRPNTYAPVEAETV